MQPIYIPHKKLQSLNDRQLKRFVDGLNEKSPTSDADIVHAINAVIDMSVRDGDGDIDNITAFVDDWLSDIDRWADFCVEYDEDNDEYSVGMLSDVDDID